MYKNFSLLVLLQIAVLSIIPRLDKFGACIGRFNNMIHILYKQKAIHFINITEDFPEWSEELCSVVIKIITILLIILLCIRASYVFTFLRLISSASFIFVIY